MALTLLKTQCSLIYYIVTSFSIHLSVCLFICLIVCLLGCWDVGVFGCLFVFYIDTTVSLGDYFLDYIIFNLVAD